MTIPYERFRAVNQTRQFLFDLLDPKKTPRVPKDIRRQALWCLRHYPHQYEMDRATQLAPELFAVDFNTSAL